MKTSENISEISKALVRAQAKMGAATKGASNPFFKSKYADLGAVMEVIKDPLNENGIAVLQPVFSEEGCHFIETILIHESGQFLSSGRLKLELHKIDPQFIGSVITYMKRYQLQAFLGIPSEDDDGNAAADAYKQKALKPSFKLGEEELSIISSLREAAQLTAIDVKTYISKTFGKNYTELNKAEFDSLCTYLNQQRKG